jgi:hypothetical protein
MEVNCTEPSLSVRVPWFRHSFTQFGLNEADCSVKSGYLQIYEVTKLKQAYTKAGTRNISEVNNVK